MDVWDRKSGAMSAFDQSGHQSRHRQIFFSFTPLRSLRRCDGHRLSATGEGVALRTNRAYHDSLDKRFGNLPISRPFDNEVRPGSSARILSGNEGLRRTKWADRDGGRQVAVKQIPGSAKVVDAQKDQRLLLGGIVDSQCGGKADLAFAAPQPDGRIGGNIYGLPCP